MGFYKRIFTLLIFSKMSFASPGARRCIEVLGGEDHASPKTEAQADSSSSPANSTPLTQKERQKYLETAEDLLDGRFGREHSPPQRTLPAPTKEELAIFGDIIKKLHEDKTLRALQTSEGTVKLAEDAGIKQDETGRYLIDTNQSRSIETFKEDLAITTRIIDDANLMNKVSKEKYGVNYTRREPKQDFEKLYLRYSRTDFPLFGGRNDTTRHSKFLEKAVEVEMELARKDAQRVLDELKNRQRRPR